MYGVNPYTVGITVADATRRLIYEAKDREAIQARLGGGIQIPLMLPAGGTVRGKLFFALTEFPHDLTARFQSVNEPATPRRTAARLSGVARLADFSRQGCGSIVLRNRPLPPDGPLEIRGTTWRTASIGISKLVLRNGPGSWADNAAWDEYELKIVNPGDEPLVVHEVSLVDSLARRFASQHSICPGLSEDFKKNKQVAPNAIVALNVLGLAYNRIVAMAARQAADEFAAAIDQRRSQLPVVIPRRGEARLTLLYPISPAAKQLVLEFGDSGNRDTVVLELAALGADL
ncbi:MAG: hypothetical protein JNJ55_09495 [Betaproteobacteria bacterium]|nr:hypothetical protein [Betaproteobacteria bacterium]